MKSVSHFQSLVDFSFANVKNKIEKKRKFSAPSISSAASGKLTEATALVKLISTSEQCYGITTPLCATIRTLKKDIISNEHFVKKSFELKFRFRRLKVTSCLEIETNKKYRNARHCSFSFAMMNKMH